MPAPKKKTPAKAPKQPELKTELLNLADVNVLKALYEIWFNETDQHQDMSFDDVVQYVEYLNKIGQKYGIYLAKVTQAEPADE